MKANTLLYVGLSVVFLASFGLALYLPATEMLKGVYGLPAVGALFTALWTIYRDDEAHRKLLALEKHKQFLSLGVTSHMAVVAFDKHVDFCEKYIKRLMQGPSSDNSAIKYEDFSRELKTIRDNHAPWVSSKMNDELSACEVVWKQFGLSAQFSRETCGDLQKEYNGKAKELFDKIYAIGDFSGKPTLHQEVINIIQGILGANDLAKLREILIQEAAKSLTS